MPAVKNKTYLLMLWVVILTACSLLAKGQSDDLVDILSNELDREWKVLSKAEVPVYYVSYRVEDNYTFYASAEFGSLIGSNSGHQRTGDVNLRVGDYSRDNSHEYAGAYGGSYFGGYGGQSVPLENKKEAITQSLWRITNEKYHQAVERYKRIINMDDDPSEIPDFSKESPSTYVAEKLELPEDTGKWEETIKSLSSLFLKEESLVNGDVQLSSTSRRQYFIDTEGNKIVQNTYISQLSINASIVAENGEIVPLYKTYAADLPKNFPDTSVIKNDINELIGLLKKLKTAPLAEPYTGPAILHPRAAGVFFHEIFGHRIEGHRLKRETDGQTFKEKLGTRVLPKSFNITSNPTLKHFDNTFLNGYYKYDDQGIEAQQVNVVSNGILQTFLMSRSPLKSVQKSNGHGRSQIGLNPVARQSNLIIASEKSYSMDKLRNMLIKECKAQNKEYGYYFMDVTGGFTRTDRYAANAFNIMPNLVYRIYVDGRPDELVRGVDLIGTPLAMFAEIAAASDDRAVFNGTCGAESGGIPVSAISPGLLVRRIETQKKPVGQKKKVVPLLPRPVEINN